MPDGIQEFHPAHVLYEKVGLVALIADLPIMLGVIFVLVALEIPIPALMVIYGFQIFAITNNYFRVMT